MSDQPLVTSDELEREVAQTIFDSDPLVRPAEVIRLVRRYVAREIEEANRAARFGINGASAVEIASGLPRPADYMRGRGG